MSKDTVETDDAVICLPCKCGHSEHDHTWQARAETSNTLIHTGSCAHSKRDTSPDSLTGPNVILLVCECRKYDPDLAAAGIIHDGSI